MRCQWVRHEGLRGERSFATPVRYVDLTVERIEPFSHRLKGKRTEGDRSRSPGHCGISIFAAEELLDARGDTLGVRGDDKSGLRRLYIASDRDPSRHDAREPAFLSPST